MMKKVNTTKEIYPSARKKSQTMRLCCLFQQPLFIDVNFMQLLNSLNNLKYVEGENL